MNNERLRKELGSLREDLQAHDLSRYTPDQLDGERLKLCLRNAFLRASILTRFGVIVEAPLFEK